MSPEKSKKLTVKQEKLMSGILSGLTIADAAREAGLKEGTAWNLACGSDRPHFKEELDRRREEQTERLLVDKPDRSKESLLSELEEIAEKAKGLMDLPTWTRTVVERGKMLGYYVERKQIDGRLTVKPPARYDWHSMPLEKRLEMDKELEAIKLEGGAE